MFLHSFSFLVLFLGTFFLYYLCSDDYKKQNVILVLASYIFYGFANLKMIPLLLGASVVFYTLALWLKDQMAKDNTKAASCISILGVLLGVGLLLFFKYLNFFADSFVTLLSRIGLKVSWTTLNIILPVGVSFYAFKLISYIIEVHRAHIEPCKDFIQFGTYIAFFPTILSGPIDRPNSFLPQLSQARVFSYAKATDGCRQILWGFLQKTIADTISIYVNQVWDSDAISSLPVLALSAFLYSFQLYFDFAGYSNMAIGFSKNLGIDVACNFNYPYFARCLSEFWRKWHMSLTSWLTDYIFIPLGGNRKGRFRTMLNTLIVFGLCGLWHGANWTFVLWGLYCGICMSIASLYSKSKEKWKRTPVQFDLENVSHIVCVFIVVSIGWILFRADSIKQILAISNALITKPVDLSLLVIPKRALLLVIMAVTMEWHQRNKEHPLQIENVRGKWIRPAVYYTIAVLVLILGTQNETFIYAQF